MGYGSQESVQSKLTKREYDIINTKIWQEKQNQILEAIHRLMIFLRIMKGNFTYHNSWVIILLMKLVNRHQNII